MFGKQPLKKTLQRAQRNKITRTSRPKTSLRVGNWKFEENSDGDLIAYNEENQKSVIISSIQEEQLSPDALEETEE